MSAYWRERRGHPPGHPELPFWTPAEDAVLGTDTDAAVARRLGRSFRAVKDRRRLLGIPPFVVKVDGRRLKRLWSAAGLTQAGLAAMSGVHVRPSQTLRRVRRTGSGGTRRHGWRRRWAAVWRSFALDRLGHQRQEFADRERDKYAFAVRRLQAAQTAYHRAFACRRACHILALAPVRSLR
jgi:hypothetical protein